MWTNAQTDVHHWSNVDNLVQEHGVGYRQTVTNARAVQLVLAVPPTHDLPGSAVIVYVAVQILLQGYEVPC